MYRFYTVILFFSMIPCQARLSETMQQSITRYGPALPILGVPILTGYTEALFEKNGIKLIAAFKGDVCSQETFWNSDREGFILRRDLRIVVCRIQGIQLDSREESDYRKLQSNGWYFRYPLAKRRNNPILFKAIYR